MWRRKRLALLIFLIVTVSVVVFSYYKPPVYEAKTIIQLDEREGPGLLETAGLVINPLNIETEAAIITTRPILERAAIIAGMTEADPDSIKNSVSVSILKNTDLIEIKARANNPEDAKNLANAIAKAYVDYLVEERTKDADTLINTINTEVERTKRNSSDEASNINIAEIEKTLELYKGLKGINPAKIVEEAIPPLKPISSPLWLNALVGIMLGLMSGIFVVFIVEYLEKSYKRA
jgi:uncharacterized protein involved in exopolysaccharide biosynthesis